MKVYVAEHCYSDGESIAIVGVARTKALAASIIGRYLMRHVVWSPDDMLVRDRKGAVVGGISEYEMEDDCQ